MGARFVRLGLSGFKSFADATSLAILPGLTGIVGPNGCGKSNVAEALRWAMGEANARHLRGGEMDDVIFAGTAHRSSRNLAEVSLTIEDDERGLPPPFAGQAELQVVRRIERGAGSGYRVNGREARARDVQTLFSDLASGARSSAMVSQGRVSMLVNARPEERRTVLEEAAGIVGLHTRRTEAETRLRAAAANLERAGERRAQLDKQLEGLRGQAKQAARYRAVMASLLEAEAALLAIRRAGAERARGQAVQSAESGRRIIGEATTRMTMAIAEAGRLQADLPAFRGAEAAGLARLERARIAEESLAADTARAKAEIEDTTKRHAQLARDLAHAQSVLGDAEAADARLVAETGRLRAEIAAHPSLLAAARAEAQAAQAALQSADQAAAVTAAQASEASARSNAARHVLAEAQARARRAEETSAQLTAERRRVAAQDVEPARLTAAAVEFDAAEQAAAAARLVLEQAEATRAQAVPLAAAARHEQARCDATRQKLSAEAAALAEVLSVADAERWPPLLDSMAVPPGLEAALGAVLGEELAAAANPDAARHWRTLPALPGVGMPWRPLAADVRGPAVLARALSAIGLVDSEAEGDAAQASLTPGQSVVSAAGGVWRWDGYTVRAGALTAAAIRLQQRNRLTRIKAELAGVEQAANAARATREGADRRDREATATEQQARQTRRGTEAALERARNTAQSLRQQADVCAARLTAADEQSARLSPELDAATVALIAATQEAEAQPDAAALRVLADRARASVQSARQRESAAGRALDGLERAEQARQTRLLTISREREDRRIRAADQAGQAKDLEARVAEALAHRDRLIRVPARMAQAAEAARVALAEAEAAFQHARSGRLAAEQDAERAATEGRTAEQAVYAAREQLVRSEAALAAAEQRLASALAESAEREGALPPCPAPADVSAAAEERGRARLHRLMKERDSIGAVNLRAEIESDAIVADLAMIAREGDELGTAVAKLRGSIGHLNREGRERLTAVFQQVDREFQALFGRMFGGGRAYLALVGSDDPLQAGLEIYAQPPGKKLTALSLLSGGEQALTALSLIFAMFRCNPAPLCVLDEVDAPLDDANVVRFCLLLSDIAREAGTRFLVVTHHQVTMAAMDNLYGVTMQERGISRLISVDLSRAVRMSDQMAAE